MTYPNAAGGVKKIYISQILQIIAAILSIIIAIIGVGSVAAASTGTDVGIGAAAGGLIGMGAFTVIVAILGLIAFIIELVGVVAAGKDEPAFKTALYCTLIALIVGFIASFIPGVFGSIVTLIGNAFNIMATIFIVRGIQNLSRNLGEEDLVAKGDTLIKLFVCSFGLGLILNFIKGLLGANTTSVLAVILSIVGIVLEIVAFFMFMSYLKKAKNLLAIK